MGNQAAKLRAKIVVGSLGNHPTLEGIDDVEIVQGTYFDIWKVLKLVMVMATDITIIAKVTLIFSSHFHF